MSLPLHQHGPDGKPAIRNWQAVMQPKRLAAMQPSRFSGVRAFVAKMVRERWDISLQRFDIDETASGTVVYSIRTPKQEFSFIAFSYPPSAQGRTGRIIGRAWDMMGTLNEGPATETDIESARVELPKLYSGRATPNALVWCRSNRSMRAFTSTLEALAGGEQPKLEDLNAVCYLMRNTGLDGNGTFGTRSFPSLGPDHALGGVLEAQLLVGYLMREYACDLVSRLAQLKSEKAVPLAPELRRYLGVGNGSALGLIFFIHRHPRLLNSWLKGRETVIAQALGLTLGAEDPGVETLMSLVERAVTFRREDRAHYETFASSQKVAEELEIILADLKAFRASGEIEGVVPDYPFDVLARKYEGCFEPETYETFLSLLIELLPEAADALATEAGGADELAVNPCETVQDLKDLLKAEYQWAFDLDMTGPGAREFVWYKSETAEEPRRGARSEVPEARDLGLDVPGGIQALSADLEAEAPDMTMARFLLKYPAHRLMVARAQSLKGQHFHTPHANINADDFVPIDLVRLMNVAFHGIDKTRDYLNRNLRGVLYHGAPTPDDIRAGRGETWFYPAEPTV
ncbi:hypothetical protein [uncultured Roseibium sp.]|uniref:hypothetical protein n=1 Tax=uncultured Roseibium sp. TaxID=1936171 RepID=UPI003216B651